MRSVSSAFWAGLQAKDLSLVELIRLNHPNLTRRWTTTNVPLISSGEVYSPFPGSSEGVAENAALQISVAKFMFANRSGEFDQLLLGANFDGAEVIVDRVHANSPDLGRLEIFRGTIADIQYTRNMIEGSVRNLWGTVFQSWPQHSYKDICSWRFGSTGCGYNTTSVTLTYSATQIRSATNLQITVSTGLLSNSFANGHFDFGRITFLSGANSGDVRTIRNQSGDTIFLSHRLSAVASGSFSIFPGCRKRFIADCHSRYNNTSAYLGFGWLPVQEDF